MVLCRCSRAILELQKPVFHFGLQHWNDSRCQHHITPLDSFCEISIRNSLYFQHNLSKSNYFLRIIFGNLFEICFSKGSSILRMFEFILGENEFTKQLSEYLNVNSHKTVTYKDLFAQLSQVKINQ